MPTQNPKDLNFFPAAYEAYRKFPEEVQDDGGYQLHRLQVGLHPDDSKPLTRVGSGVYEIRLSDEANEYRVIYVAQLGDKIWVLHAFQKKTRAIRNSDIELAKGAYSALEKMLLEEKVLEKKQRKNPKN